MNRFFSVQRAPSGARIFSAQAGNGEPPVVLVVDAPLASDTTILTGSVREVLALIDEPAPRSRCIFLASRNRIIRL